MTLALSQSFTAVAVNITASFLAIGGTGPYTYAVIPGGAGGTIDPSSGLYTAPAVVSSNPATLYDTVQVTDDSLDTASASILVGNPLMLFGEILQNQLSLANDHIYFWDQKIFQPTDSGLYIAISVPRSKPFSNVNRSVSSDSSLVSEQFVSVSDTVDVDLISRDSEARDRKAEVVMAFNSTYAQQQQEANSFYIGKLPPNAQFVNLSQIDGAAIPYRYKISVVLQYAYSKSKLVEFFSTFAQPTIIH